jgi:two-component system, NarL family, sensor histidine kinase UhpB
MALRTEASGAADARPRRRGRGARFRTTLFRRLFLAYAAVLTAAVLVLVLAPITVSVPVTASELAVILAGFAAMLLVYRRMLQRALRPLERLTVVMQRVDPLAPGQRVDPGAADEELVALASAFNGMLDRLEGERRDSGRRALAAQEDERRRIARELHDEIGQILTGLVLQSETLSHKADDDVRGDVERMRETARHGAEEVRQIARRLRPEALEELGLQSALQALTADVARQTGLTVDRSLERGLPLNAEQELVIYRVAQESLTNVVRHAQAEGVQLRLRAEPDGGVELVVRDDGVGLPHDAERESNGIRGMRERALLVGARLSLRRLDPRGTEVRLRLPPDELGKRP